MKEWMNGGLGHDSALQDYTGPGTTWANEMILLWIMPLAQDRSFDLLASGPARYHCTTDVPTGKVIII